jgi:glutamate-1-semialdehyde 2,1-aminomutase
VRSVYEGLDERWNERARRLNERLAAAGLPVRVANLSTIWTLYYAQPSRYNWMLQFYLRAAGLALSWVGTGRLIFSLNYTEEDFAAVADRIVSAAAGMQGDGWWWSHPELTNKSIKRRVLREMLHARLGLGGISSSPQPAAAPAGAAPAAAAAPEWASTSHIGSISSPRIK